MKKKFWQGLQKSMVLNGNRKAVMRNIWMSITSEKRTEKEVQELEQEKEYLTAENEELTAQIAESRADIQILKDDKEQAIREKQEAEQRAEDAEKELKSLEDRRNVLQPIMDNASKEIKEYGMIKTIFTGGRNI